MSQQYRRTLALGIARAMLAGPVQAGSIAARVRTAVGERAAWIDALAMTVEGSCAMSWPMLRAPVLAARLLRADAFQAAFERPAPPRLRRYILRPERQLPPPLALDGIDLPTLATWGDLAPWLGIEADALDWFSAAAARRRHAPLPQHHYRWRWWPKPDGGVRLIEAPRPRLKALQRRLLDGLVAKVPAHEAAFGFVPGRGVLDHAARHAGQPVVLRFDLRDFFGSVRASRIHALFAELGYGTQVCRALTALVTSRVAEPVLQRLRDDGAIDAPQAARWRGAHLPQGAPTSPALATLCAFNLDLRLDGLAHALGARYSRYADDIALSGGPLLAARRDRIESLVGAAALEEGFRLNHRKTRCQTRVGAQRLCGVVVNEHPNLPRHEFDRLKALLYRCVIDGPSAQNRAAVPDWRAQLTGRVAWARQVNPARAARLTALLERIDWSR